MSRPSRARGPTTAFSIGLCHVLLYQSGELHTPTSLYS
jgi:hypothetical protein